MALLSTARFRRGLGFVATVFAVLIGVLLSSGPAFADPDTGTEGGSAALAQKLEDVAKGYYEAKATLVASQARQAQLVTQLRDSQLALTRLTVAVGSVAAARYEGQQLSVLTGLFSGAGDTRTLLQGAAIADYLVWRDDEQLRSYREARDAATRDQAALDNELKVQAKAVTDLDAQKRAAEKALSSVGGMVSAGYTGPAQAAQPAPRTASGGWPSESASIKDPTGTGGYITPRMYHTLIEAQLAGFTRFTKCWRSATWGEHPKGRACDFSVTPGDFGGVAAGADKAYGTKLAQWGVANADALGVMYVIWFRQIWTPSTGWRAYNADGTDPSAEHENHVHISML
jgi:hypothetical protein